MTLYQFKQLNEAKQVALVEHSGSLIAERESGFCHIQLYQVDAFYVELYHHTHFNVIVKMKIFTNTSRLEPYLKHIDIDSLFCPTGR